MSEGSPNPTIIAVDRWASPSGDGRIGAGSQYLTMSDLKRTLGDSSVAEQELEKSLGDVGEGEGRGREFGKSKTVGFKRQMTTKGVKLVD